MAILNVWQCTSGGTVATELGGAQRPLCPAGQGAYVQIDTAPQTEEQIVWDSVVWATAAALLMWALGVGVGMVISMVKKGRI